MGPPSRKDGPIIRVLTQKICMVHYVQTVLALWLLLSGYMPYPMPLLPTIPFALSKGTELTPLSHLLAFACVHMVSPP